MNLMFSCRKVAEMLSQSFDEPLGWFDDMRLRLHLRMCGNCSKVEQQLKAMRTLSSDMFSMDEPLSDDAEGSPPRV